MTAVKTGDLMVYDEHGETVPAKQYKDRVGPGWGSLLDLLFADLIVLDWDRVVVRLRQHYGRLKMTVSPRAQTNNAIIERIYRAEEASVSMCEVCGRRGQLGGKKQIKTLCEEHKER